MSSSCLRVARSGAVPALLVVLLAVLALVHFEVTPGEIARYGGYLIYAVLTPGVLIWRSLRGRPRSLLEDVAGGLALGFALEILVYIVLRFTGVPILVLAYPAVVIAV